MKRCAGLMLAVILAALPCAAQQDSKAKNQNENKAPAKTEPNPVVAPAPGSNSPDYVIGAEDVLNISVWKEGEVSRTVPVRPDGKISLPLLNDIQAAGLKPEELAAQITERLKKFFTDPQVTVIVVTINSRRIYITGEANRGGAIPMLPNMTALQALAGGFTMFANLKGIYILRMENGKQVKLPFDYKAVLKGKKPDLILKPGDTIVVP